MSPRKGDVITGIPPRQKMPACSMPARLCRMAQLLTSGGRVLCVTVLADNVRQAQQRAYEVAQGIRFDGMQYRHDIGHRAVKGTPA